MRAYYWEHIKSCSWFSDPIYVNLATYCISIPQYLTCAILMNLQNVVLSFGILICDTCFRYQSITTIFFPLLIIVIFFDVFVFEVHQHTIRLNWAFGHALKQKILLVFCMTSFWYHVLLLNIYSMCTCFCVVKYLRDVVYLETYTHDRWYLLIWYLIWTLCVGM
jgi:hypothetical protein